MAERRRDTPEVGVRGEEATGEVWPSLRGALDGLGDSVAGDVWPDVKSPVFPSFARASPGKDPHQLNSAVMQIAKNKMTYMFPRGAWCLGRPQMTSAYAGGDSEPFRQALLVWGCQRATNSCRRLLGGLQPPVYLSNSAAMPDDLDGRGPESSS